MGNLGQWCSKSTPPAFCGALATNFWHTLRDFPLDADVQIPSEFLDTCSSMLVQDYGDELGPDFAGGVP